MSVKVNLEMKVKDFKVLAEFLEGMEYEIATDEHPYGALRELFKLVFDAEPDDES